MNTHTNSDVEQLSNLTRGQLQIWTGQQLDPAAPLYNMALCFSIQASIEYAAFAQAIQTLINRRDVLRTVINQKDGVPQQVVLPSLDYSLELKDFSAVAEPSQAAQDWTSQRSKLPFDLSRCNFDTALLKLAEDHFIWYFNQHHIVVDIWSFSLIYQDVQDTYRSIIANEPQSAVEPPQFQTYADFERHTRARDSRTTSFWKRLDSLELSTPNLYGTSLDRSSTATKRFSLDLGRARSDRLRAIARRKEARSLTEDLSLFNIFSTLLFTYIHRVSGQTKLAIGAPAHNRTSREFKQTAGLFMEVYPLQVDVDSGDSFLNLLQRVHLAANDLLRNATPGASKPQNSRYFGAVLNYIHTNFGPFAGNAATSEWIHPGHGDRGHHLRLQVHDLDEQGRFILHFDFNCQTFNEALSRLAIGHFERLLDAFIEDWHIPLGQVCLLSADERTLSVDPAQGALKSPPPWEGSTVIQEFERWAALDPAAVALSCGELQLTYGELNESACEFANNLLNLGCDANAPVGICTQRSPEAVIAMLGAFKARCAYVPIDPALPVARIAYLLDDAGVRVVATQSEAPVALPAQYPSIVVTVATGRSADQPKPASTPHADDVAYILYTSGSTGQPKGVVVSQGALAHYVFWAREQYVNDKMLSFPLFTPLAFDLTVTSLFVPLTSGGRIVIYPEPSGKIDFALLDVLKDDAVDIIKLTPSHLTAISDREFRHTRVRQLILGGEDLRSDVARQALNTFGEQVVIHNEYGPTEATVGCILHTFDPASDRQSSVPIGRPIRDVQALILDNHLNPVPRGVPGELFIAGPGLAEGYKNRPTLTAESFVPHAFSEGEKMYRTGDLARRDAEGTIHFLGRQDHQVKIRGVRIELGEIEAAIARASEVDACVVDLAEHAPPVDSTEVVHCRRCGLPSNYPEAGIDDGLICRLCRGFDAYQARAERYFKSMDDLKELFAAGQTNSASGYDCLALLSGGKDSTYVLCRLVDMGLKVLAFTLDNGYISEQAKANIQRVVDTLGVDHMFGVTPMMNEVFVDSLQRHANVCNGCFKTIYTLSVNIALEKRIRFIVTGLSRGQFFETRLSEELFTNPKVDIDDIDRMILEARKAYHRIDDAVARLPEAKVFSSDDVFSQVDFIDFYRYCSVSLDEMLAYLNDRVPWIRPDDTGRSTNCLINDVGIHIHKRDRRYHNYALPYSWDVRMGHKTRTAALAELDDDIDVARVQQILSEIGYDEVATAPTLQKQLVAYYVADSELDSTELQGRLASDLPDYMIPSIFVRLDELPLTRNGKIDRAALPRPNSKQRSAKAEYVEPSTPLEKSLAAIWADVLRLDRVGVHDNFFDLGGDSIMAIQIVGRAQQVGAQISPDQIFSAATIEELAKCCATTALATAEQGLVSGRVPLTPIQRWFFEQSLLAPHYWNQSLRLTVPDHFDPDVFELSLRHVVLHHDALRLRFEKGGGETQARLDGDAQQHGPRLARCDGRRLEPDAWRSRTKQFEMSLNEQTHLTDGQLVHAAFLQGPDADEYLILTIHHLAMDALSWPVLLEDLSTIYRQLSRRDAPQLPPKTASYQQWAKQLTDFSQSAELLEEIDFWKRMTPEPGLQLPNELSVAEADSQSGSHEIRTTWRAEETSLLVSQTGRHRGAAPHEILLAALALTVAKWRSANLVTLAMETHGREAIAKNTSVSRTVGWFTSLFPLTLDLSVEDAPAEMIRSMRRQLRHVPRGGIGYGCLRYLHGQQFVRDQLSCRPQPEILFNYLGRLEQLAPPDSEFQLRGELELWHSSNEVRPFPLEVNAFIENERLHVNWAYSTKRLRPDTVRRLSQEFYENLQLLCDSWQSSTKEEVHPADFPLADLDERKLQKLSALLKKRDSDSRPSP